MTTFVDALRKKYEKLTECNIFENYVQKSPNRIGANLLFPARTLSMDCQQISKVGCEDELFRAAGHVAELDLSGNKLSCWNEIFILLRCLKNLESLNLSQNPLGPNAEAELQRIRPDSQTGENDEVMDQSDPIDITTHPVRHSPSGSPILRFMLYETPRRNSRDAVSLDDGHMDENRENYSVPMNNKETSCEIKKTQLDGPVEFDEHSIKKCAPPIRTAIENNVLTPASLFPRLTVLALNSTFIPWTWVLELLNRFPNLTTLHVALNNYGADEDHLDGAGDTFDININIPVFHRLRTLYYSENNISSWWTVCRLGRHFPSLEHLVLLGNPLAHIPAPLPSKESLGARGGRVVEKLPEPTRLSPTPPGHKTAHRLFTSLHTLGLSETLLERWESIDALGEWMPKLANLRLGNVLPVFQSWLESDCRAHVIARLPNLTTYNRSVIDQDEREAAERDFVRYYSQIEPSLRPSRYWELERQHGRLQPLADIDLSPKRFVRVRVVLDGRETIHELNLGLKVSQVKRQLLRLFDIDPAESRSYKLFYYDQVISPHQGPEELRYPARAMHSYQPETGDLFELMRNPEQHSSTRSR
ncbi:hypothetical protein CRM22_008055 [Opisthorchis felineus]|uniref:Ubiquitin-like domain-containing protein n=2 Tax=Opisthorchis felineus TaxID=147828 RepID=A0A4S2LD04_OPIFE|nr:hypothetical protein CRM22_008055 [Opisthorchis felineus]